MKRMMRMEGQIYDSWWQHQMSVRALKWQAHMTSQVGGAPNQSRSTQATFPLDES